VKLLQRILSVGCGQAARDEGAGTVEGAVGNDAEDEAGLVGSMSRRCRPRDRVHLRSLPPKTSWQRCTSHQSRLPGWMRRSTICPCLPVTMSTLHSRSGL
jgi:hypothetical protein